MKQFDTLWRTVWGEARGEDFHGQSAVAHVILNRTKDPRWPNTPHAVARQPWQFSAWNENDPNRPQMEQATEDTPGVIDAMEAALFAMKHPTEDPTGGANHYLNARVVKDATGRLPDWYDPTKITAVIGDHQFLKL